nr:synaptic vesicle glycoprotein 2A-like isoform X3 [Aedes albopictus]
MEDQRPSSEHTDVVAKPPNSESQTIEIHHIQLRHYASNDTGGSSNGKPHSYSYNEALELIGNGKFQTFLLFVCGFCLMSVINETLNMGFIISAAECDLHLTFSDKGMLNGAAFCGVVISSHFWGFLSDTWGRRKVILLATSVSLAFSVLSSFAVHVWMLIITRFLVGVFISGNAATTYAYLAEFHTDKTRAKVISWAAMFMAFGMIYLPFVAYFIIPLDTHFELYSSSLGMRYGLWRFYLLLSSLTSVLIIGGILCLPESGKFLLTSGEHDKVLEVLSQMYRWNKGVPDYMFPIKSITLDAIDSAFVEQRKREINQGLRYVWEQTVPLFRPPLVGNTVRASFLMFGLFMASSGVFMWMPDILNTYVNFKDAKLTICDVVEIIHNNRTQMSAQHIVASCPVSIDASIFMITTIMGILFLACYILNGAVINMVGKKLLLNIWYVVCGVCGVAALWTSDFYLTLLVIVIFLAVGCCGSVLSAISVDLFPTNYRLRCNWNDLTGKVTEHYSKNAAESCHPHTPLLVDQTNLTCHAATAISSSNQHHLNVYWPVQSP